MRTDLRINIPQPIINMSVPHRIQSDSGSDFLTNRKWIRVGPDKWAHPDRGCFFTLAEALRIERNPATV